MKKSPLKQQQAGATGVNQSDRKEQATQSKTMMNAGMDILSEAKKRKAWDLLQLQIKSLDPLPKQLRKHGDEILRRDQKKRRGGDGGLSLSRNFLDVYIIQIKSYQDQLYAALKVGDKKGEKEAMMKLAAIETTMRVIKDNKAEFFDDHFSTESQLSKGVSQQQISFGTQMYCDNPDLVITFASNQDVLKGTMDHFGDVVKVEGQYALVEDFSGKMAMVNVMDGNKNMFIVDKLKAVEYLTFVNETYEMAQNAMREKAAVKIDLGRINYKIDSIFGYQDGTASEEQDNLVLQFAHDDDILKDGMTFKRHLLEHPNIKNLNYGDFDLEVMDAGGFEVLLDKSDKKHWSDHVSQDDRLRLVDAICNVDNPAFSMILLRTLVKEYYTYKIEDAWWKGMGFDEGKLGIMRLKQNELMKDRFKREKAKASSDGKKDFTFDGRVYPTGADLEKQKKEKEQAIKRAEAEVGGGAPQQTGVTPTNPNQ